jgi:hypothetical protein
MVEVGSGCGIMVVLLVEMVIMIIIFMVVDVLVVAASNLLHFDHGWMDRQTAFHRDENHLKTFFSGTILVQQNQALELYLSKHH